MEEIISCCGLVCSECGAYIATQTGDGAKRAEVAAEWSKMYDADLTASDIDCDGCLSDGPRLFHHATVCEIRRCARERHLTNCAHCGDYACDLLRGLFAMVPEAKDRLDGVRAGA